jgi:hypothetical protein
VGWANIYIEKLQQGETVKFRPRGSSMKGKIESGNLITVSSKLTDLKVGDVVLCKVKGSEYVHLIKAIDGERYLIGNNKGRINGWISRNGIFGKVTSIEP